MFPERLWLRWNITPVDETEMRPIAEVLLLFPAHRHMATLKFKTKADTRLDKHAVNRERKNKEVILFGNPTTFHSLKHTNVMK